MPYKPKELLKVLHKLGFILKRQRGSHAILQHPDGRMIVLPMHQATIKTGYTTKY